MALEGNLIANQISHCHLHPVCVFGMLLHFLLDETDGLGRNVEAVVIKARVVPKERKESIADTAAQLHKLAYFFCIRVKVLEQRDGLNLSLQISSVFEEAALVEFVKLIPYFLSFIFCLLINLGVLDHFVLL